MSAYIVDRDHVWFLVSAADRLSRRGSKFSWYSKAKGKRLQLGEDISLDAFGQMLWDENVRSIVGRYPDCKAEDGTLKYDQMPGAGDEVFLYQHPRELGWHHIDPMAVFSACACYEYQSCEHDEWEESEAWAAIQSLKGDAIRALPGYEDQKWGAPEPDSKAVSILSLGR